MQSYNARLGLVMFAIYLLLYGGFVLLNAFSPTTMENTYAGVNLAIWYGFALIVGAVIMAMIYGLICKDEDEPLEEKSLEKEPLAKDFKKGGSQ